jgi:hypothetical protein
MSFVAGRAAGGGFKLAGVAATFEEDTAVLSPPIAPPAPGGAVGMGSDAFAAFGCVAALGPEVPPACGALTALGETAGATGTAAAGSMRWELRLLFCEAQELN